MPKRRSSRGRARRRRPLALGLNQPGTEHVVHPLGVAGTAPVDDLRKPASVTTISNMVRSFTMKIIRRASISSAKPWIRAPPRLPATPITRPELATIRRCERPASSSECRPESSSSSSRPCRVRSGARLRHGSSWRLPLPSTSTGPFDGHKEFVTALFRAAYAEGDVQHRERWSLDWPEMRVESIGN